MLFNQINNAFQRPLPPVTPQPDIQFGTPGPNLALAPKQKQASGGGSIIDRILGSMGGGGGGKTSGLMNAIMMMFGGA